MRQMGEAARCKEPLKQGIHRGDTVFPLRPRNSWIEEHQHRSRGEITHQEVEPLIYLHVREGRQNTLCVLKQVRQVGNGHLWLTRGIPPLAVTFEIPGSVYERFATSRPLWDARISRVLVNDVVKPFF